MIVDQLMVRDLQRTPGVSIALRRTCLQQLAIVLSKRDTRVATEGVFFKIIDNEFRNELRYLDADQRLIRKNELFEHIRTSSTLTRSEDKSASGYLFSHNSLREYLATEFYVLSAIQDKFYDITIPITQPMRLFVASMGTAEIEKLAIKLSNHLKQGSHNKVAGLYISLFWDAFAIIAAEKQTKINSVLANGNNFDSLLLRDIVFISSEIVLMNASFERSEMVEVQFLNVDLSSASFSGAWLDSVVFIECDLSNSSFEEAFVYECQFVDCTFANSKFNSLGEDLSIVVNKGDQKSKLIGNEARGYLSYNGASTGDTPEYFIYKNHPKYAIVEKICEKLCEQRNRQENGLTRKGEARKDPPFAREFLALLVSSGWVAYDRGMVGATAEGRRVLPEIVQHQRLPHDIATFLRDRP